MSNYVPLSQHEDFKEDHTTDIQSLPPPTWFEFLSSPLFLGSVLVALLAANVVCFAFTMQHTKAVFETLKSHLDFTDTRELPRPDQYDGLHS